MKCFYHNDIDAVGICTYCGKGICAECAIEKNDKIVCSEHAQQDITPAKTFQMPKSFINKFASVYAVSALIYLVTGMILMVAGFIHMGFFGIYILIPLGIIFMLSSALQYIAAKSFLED